MTYVSDLETALVAVVTAAQMYVDAVATSGVKPPTTVIRNAIAVGRFALRSAVPSVPGEKVRSVMDRLQCRGLSFVERQSCIEKNAADKCAACEAVVLLTEFSELASLVNQASMGGSKSDGETWIGWQDDGDGRKSDRVKRLARQLSGTIEASLGVVDGQCCERDYDRDGNCDRHRAGGGQR